MLLLATIQLPTVQGMNKAWTGGWGVFYRLLYFTAGCTGHKEIKWDGDPGLEMNHI